MSKIHCENQNDVGWTNCGRSEKCVLIVDGYIFGKLKDKFKCKRCKKKEDKRQRWIKRQLYLQAKTGE